MVDPSEKNLQDKSLLSDISNRTEYHPPDVKTAGKHEYIRLTIHGTMVDVASVVPPGREQSLALTKLEEAMFWANAGIARQNFDGSRK